MESLDEGLNFGYLEREELEVEDDDKGALLAEGLGEAHGNDGLAINAGLASKEDGMASNLAYELEDEASSLVVDC